MYKPIPPHFHWDLPHLSEPTVPIPPLEREAVLSRFLGYLLGKRMLKPSTVEREVRTLKSLLRHNVALNQNRLSAFLIV